MKTIIFKIIAGQNLRFNVDVIGGTNPKTWEWSVSDGFSNSGTGDGDDIHTISAANITKNSVFTAHAVQTQGGGSNLTHQLEVRYPPGGALNVLQARISTDLTSTLTGRVLFSSRIEGQPTYLEKLDSTDQYTKSQYIPR